jgi:hypothetical protein
MSQITRSASLLAASLLLAGACSSLSARPLVRVDVVDRTTGQTLPQYGHRHDTWIPGAPGHRYAVRLANTSGERVLVVLSVDGVNAVTGETADPSQAGYVLAPWQSAEITGWRKSLDHVAQFVFTDLADSYAARTGRPDNVGTIGVAVFRELPTPRSEPPAPAVARDDDGAGRRSKLGAARAPSAASEAAADAYGDDARQRLGTGHGARAWAPVGRTHFARASRNPAQLTELRYDDMDALAALGVVPRPYAHPSWRHAPRAFPSGFVSDPPR